MNWIWGIREKLFEFVRRYKGPSGTEPDVEPDEIVFRIVQSPIEIS